MMIDKAISTTTANQAMKTQYQGYRAYEYEYRGYIYIVFLDDSCGRHARGREWYLFAPGFDISTSFRTRRAASEHVKCAIDHMRALENKVEKTLDF